MQSPFLKALLKMLAELDQRYLDLDTIAECSGYSKYYLCRAFHAATQEPLQTYLRRLRLARAAESLREGKRVLDVALDCGYQSQEAFHRAFSKMFGVTPKALQHGEHHPSLLLKKPWQETLMPPKPLACRRETLDSFSLCGTGDVFDYEHFDGIETLWREFHRVISPSVATYGVTLAHPANCVQFRYFTAVLANGQCNDTWERIRVPAQTYYVFRHQGQAHSLMRAFNYIWGVWLPEHPGIAVNGIDFEYYPAKYNPESESGWVDIYIPVAQ